MYARIKNVAESFSLITHQNPAALHVDLTRIAVVERRVFKDGELKAFELFFSHEDRAISASGVTVIVPAALVEVL
jgi:hypothetical protein